MKPGGYGRVSVATLFDAKTRSKLVGFGWFLLVECLIFTSDWADVPLWTPIAHPETNKSPPEKIELPKRKFIFQLWAFAVTFREGYNFLEGTT